MSSESKAEKAVLRLRKRLYRARDHAVGKDRDFNETHPLYSRFQDIDGELDVLKDHFPRIKGWEETLVTKFTSLEHGMYAFFAQSKKKDHHDSDIKDYDSDIKALDQFYKRIEDFKKAVTEQSKKLGLSPVRDLESSVLQRYGHDKEESSARKMSQEWSNREVEKKILASAAMADLRASYDNLDGLDLKLCCLFLSVFPEKAVIKKRPLIYWWIGEGLISKTGDKTAEEVGEIMFAKLINLGLIEPYHDKPDKPSPVVTACTVHPWVRYMLVLLAKEAGLFDFDPRAVACCASAESRRACLTSHEQYSSNSLYKQRLNEETEKLSSVFNVSDRYLDFGADWLPRLKRIVVLQLGRWHSSPEHHIEVVDEKFLNGFGAQKHLKYLSLRGISRIIEIPKSVAELLSLEILDLKACHNLEKLPPDIGSLRRLTHLIVSDCPLLESMPKGIEKLTNLQVLKGFVMGNSKKTPCKVADLVGLIALRRLSIYIGNEAVVKEGELAVLKESKSLRCLTISWGVKSPAPAAVIDLSFPPNLEKLCLRGIPRAEMQTSTEPKTKGKEAPGDPREQHLTELRMKKESPVESPKTRQPRPSALAKIYSGLRTRAKTKEAPIDMEDNVPQRSLKELKPSNMRNLKRLYIRGGELSSLNYEENWLWAVEILQLKYLSNFKIERDKLMAEFPHLTYLDVKCDAVLEHEHGKEIKYKEDFVLTKRDIEEERSKEKGQLLKDVLSKQKEEGELKHLRKRTKGVYISSKRLAGEDHQGYDRKSLVHHVV